MKEVFEGATEAKKADWDKADVPGVAAHAVRDAALSLLAERHSDAREMAGTAQPDEDHSAAGALIAEQGVVAAVLGHSIESGSHEDLQLEVDSEKLVKQIGGITVATAVAASLVAVALDLGIWESFFFVAIAMVPPIAIWNFWSGRQFLAHGVVPAVRDAASLPAAEHWVAVDARTFWSLADGGSELRQIAARDGVGVILVDSGGEARILVEAAAGEPANEDAWSLREVETPSST